jgi:hypothetical protein
MAGLGTIIQERITDNHGRSAPAADRILENIINMMN